MMTAVSPRRTVLGAMQLHHPAQLHLFPLAVALDFDLLREHGAIVQGSVHAHLLTDMRGQRKRWCDHGVERPALRDNCGWRAALRHIVPHSFIAPWSFVVSDVSDR